MKKMKRFLALITVVILVLLYAATLIFALIDSPWAFSMFKACIGMTVILPALLYIYFWIYKVLNKNSDDDTRSGKQPASAKKPICILLCKPAFILPRFFISHF